MHPMLVLLEPRLEKNWNSQGIMFFYMLPLMAGLIWCKSTFMMKTSWQGYSGK
jgi:hypothetical protein